jgi:hypothetical protein
VFLIISAMSASGKIGQFIGSGMLPQPRSLP